MVPIRPRVSYCTYSFFNIARYMIPVARDVNHVACEAISVSCKGGNLHLGGTVCGSTILACRYFAT